MLQTLEERSAAIDWDAVAMQLDAQGSAVIEALATPAECAALAGLYPTDAHFRSRVVMARHGFGRGEYRYFNYPLPGFVAALRTDLYPRLAPIANRWHADMGLAVRFPDRHADFIERCRAAGQHKPTPLLLQYGADDYNCLHQDLYGEHVFPGAAAERTGARLQRRRVRDDRAAPTHAVARAGAATAPGRCGGDRSAPPAGAGNARGVPREPAPWREHRAGRAAARAGHHLS
jgi:hypothetical protein